jgi:hypothetical protein
MWHAIDSLCCLSLLSNWNRSSLRVLSAFTAVSLALEQCLACGSCLVKLSQWKGTSVTPPHLHTHTHPHTPHIVLPLLFPLSKLRDFLF